MNPSRPILALGSFAIADFHGALFLLAPSLRRVYPGIPTIGNAPSDWAISACFTLCLAVSCAEWPIT